MFEGKEISILKIYFSVLIAILLSFCTQVFAQQKGFTRDNNSGKFLLNEQMSIDLITDVGKDIGLFDIPAPVTIFEQVDIQPQVQKISPQILWSVQDVNLSVHDLHKWTSSILGLHNQQTEKSDTSEVFITSNSVKLLNVEELKIKNAQLIETILTLQQSTQSENLLMNLIWQIDENIDFAIVGQYQLDMEYPDFIEYLKNDDQDQTKSALYAKLTLRF